MDWIFNQIDFDFPRLAQFINRTPALMTLDEANVEFYDRTAIVKLRSRTSDSDFEGLQMTLLCMQRNRLAAVVHRAGL